MHILVIILLLVLGIVLIVKGGDFFVDAAVWTAEISGIPKVIIGATIVSLATTLPEMIVSILAAVEGKVDMSIGNAVGSVTANLGLIMAVSIICIPAVINRREYLPKMLIMLAAAAVVVATGLSGSIQVGFAFVFVALFVVFFVENFSSAKKNLALEKDTRTQIKPEKKDIIINVIKFVGGAAGIVIGARLLVNNGSELARIAGVSERIIGVTLVAIGTSLPELITSITAIIKKQSELSVGNILGANVIDLTLIMPISSLIAGKPLPVSAQSAMIDLPACLIISVIAVVPALIASKFHKAQGAVMLAAYIVYLVITCTLF